MIQESSRINPGLDGNDRRSDNLCARQYKYLPGAVALCWIVGREVGVFVGQCLRFGIQTALNDQLCQLSRRQWCLAFEQDVKKRVDVVIGGAEVRRPVRFSRQTRVSPLS